MTSIGRGRGWTRPAEKESVLRRPGQPASPKASEFDEFIDRIYNNLNIEESPSTDKFKELIAYTDTVESQNPENLVERVWKQALEDRCFAIKISQLCAKGTRLKASLFRKMQQSYETKDEWWKENPLHLANLVWMLSFTIHLMPNIRGQSLGVVSHIGSALIDCCNLLLESATEEDTETVAIQILLNGKLLESAFPAHDEKHKNPSDTNALRDLIIKARTILVNRNVSARTRALLLLIIDFANQRYEPLTGDLRAFYASILGSSRAQENDSQFTTNREFNSEAYLYRILTKEIKSPANRNDAVSPIAQEPTRNDLSQQQLQKKKNRAPNSASSGPFPRAIRGSGASEISKEHRNDKRSPRGHKEKLTDEQVWSAKQNTGSKVWGHDDRFENDYE